MIKGLKSIRQERASLERDRVLFGSMLEDARIADTYDSLIETDLFEGVGPEEIDELIERTPESDEEDEQVERILSSENNLSVDDILGIDNDNFDDEEELDD